MQSQNRNEQLDIINSAIDIFENRFSDSVGSFIARIKIN